MILSHKHRCIFIKTNKTAGTSFEIAFSRYCGEKDIVTPISAQDEEIRQTLGYRGPQHYKPSRREYSLRQKLIAIRMGKPVEYYNHMSAREIRDLVGNKVWKTYYKFCFERNPWDRVISAYYWYTQNKPGISLTEYIHSERVGIVKRKGSGLYADNGKVMVDRIYKYEEMENSLQNIAQILALPGTLANVRKDKRPFSAVLSKDDQEYIRSMFAFEIELNGYQNYLDV
jgi:hypothetical protein